MGKNKQKKWTKKVASTKTAERHKGTRYCDNEGHSNCIANWKRLTIQTEWAHVTIYVKKQQQQKKQKQNKTKKKKKNVEHQKSRLKLSTHWLERVAAFKGTKRELRFMILWFSSFCPISSFCLGVYLETLVFKNMHFTETKIVFVFLIKQNSRE